MASTLDWSTMLAIHGALRRDLEQVGRIAGQKDGDDTRLRAVDGDGDTSRSSWLLITRWRTMRSGRYSGSTWPISRTKSPWSMRSKPSMP